jgi:hypothetical protein
MQVLPIDRLQQKDSVPFDSKHSSVPPLAGLTVSTAQVDRNKMIFGSAPICGLRFVAMRGLREGFRPRAEKAPEQPRECSLAVACCIRIALSDLVHAGRDRHNPTWANPHPTY